MFTKQQDIVNEKTALRTPCLLTMLTSAAADKWRKTALEFFSPSISLCFTTNSSVPCHYGCLLLWHSCLHWTDVASGFPCGHQTRRGTFQYAAGPLHLVLHSRRVKSVDGSCKMLISRTFERKPIQCISIAVRPSKKVLELA